MAEVKKRKVTKKDWAKVQDSVQKEFESRKKDKFRKSHEGIWKEIDRQIRMESLVRKSKDGTVIDEEWHSVLELGELAKASEIITADVMRLTFPSTRAWFESHSEPPSQLNPFTGAKVVDQSVQEFNDKALRALMVQQHLDFGLKARYELSVKEALHHGGYVSEIRFEKRSKYYSNGGIQGIGAPVWAPYSMWNAYPDPSPSVVGTDIFYTGNMILVDYMPRYILKEIAKGDGWFAENVSKIPKRTNTNKDVETEDIELVKRYGDLVIERGEGDIFLPNAKIIVANGVVVYYEQNELPYPSVIYSGYERMDVRDPYYTSPLIKLSPMQKLGSQLANKYLDNVWMKIEPPIVYDANDPQFVIDGGPRIAPGAKIGTKSSGAVTEVKIGEPQQALAGLQFIIQQMQQGLGINAIRSGAGSDVADKTATEIQTAEAKAEIRTSEFVAKQERHALRPFLYMQHELNKLYMEGYEFYNPEMDSPDFMRVTKDEMPKVVNFEIVGSRGVLGEKARQEKVSQVTAFASGNPLFGPLLEPEILLKEMYQDAGVKDPERFIKPPSGPSPEIEQLKQQMQQGMQKYEAQIADLQKQLAISKAVNEAKLQETMARAEIDGNLAKIIADFQQETAAIKTALNIVESEVKYGISEGQKILSAVDSVEKIMAKLESSESESKDSEIKNHMMMLGNSMKGMLEKMNSPKRIIKDETGRPVGIE